MADMTARILQRGAAEGAEAVDTARLTYDDRFLRRKVLTTTGGLRLLVDLPETLSVDDGDAFVAEDGRMVVVRAATENLFAVTGPDLPRIAWHIGNRHTPCQIEPDRLLIQRDRVMKDMLAGIGAEVTEVHERFTPEGGAYGHGRTMGHDHSHEHGPSHGSSNGADHAH